MPVFNVRSPDGQLFRVTAPEGATQEEIIEYAQSQMGRLGESQPSVSAPQEGITAALTGGFKRFLSTGETALESLVDPELAAQRGVERAQKIGEQYAPGASLEKVKQAYAERGLFPAVGEAISQIPSALAEQAPQIAATLGSAKLGAMAGSPLGPVGALVGGIGGAVTPSLMQLYGANLERQAEEKVPEISRSAALAAAAPGAALEVASTFIPLGRNLVGKLLGPNAEKALARGSNEAIERKAQEALTTSLLKGTAVGSAVEIPTEVTQQMLERLQAGLPLTTEDAFKEYGEAAYGAGLVGGPFGGAARVLGRPAARAEFEKIQQEEADRLAVSEEELAQRFPDVLPGGFKINREEVGREMAPEGFSIMVEGRDEPLSVVDTQEEADEKLASLTQIRERERENLLKDEEKINTDIQKAKDRLEQLEATEQTDTDDYKALKAELPTMMDESAQKIKDLYDKSAALAKPLTVMPFGEVERVNEQFNVIGPDNKPVGSFKTLGEAEAVVEQAVGKDTFKQTQQNREVAKDLYKNFVPQMRKFGLGDVGLNIVDRIENGAGGAYLDKLIRVSLEEDRPVQTMRHESLHAMKDLGFFTPQQWRALEERANKQWIKELKEAKYDDKQSRYDAYVDLFTKEGEQKGFAGKELDQYVSDAVIEESIADAFGAYDRGAKPPPGMIAALFKKIKNFFSSLGQAFRGAGFQSADDIFQQIERGKLKPAAAKEISAEKLSLPIMRGEEIPKFQEPLKEGEKEAKKLKPTVDLVGQYFDKQIKDRNGSKLDYTDKQSFDNAVKTATDEVKYQMEKEKSGLDWYEDDVKEAFKQTKKFIPELGKTDNRLLFSVIAGIMSPQTNARDNWFIAAKAFEHYMDTKTIPGNNPETGGLWQGGTQSPNKKIQLEFLDRMVKDMGKKKTLEWLFQDHTVKEINEFRQKYGNIKSGIEGKLTDMRPGLYAFGPKVGPFVSNLNGIHDVTVDKWMTRTFNRYFGTMTGADGKIIDAPTEPQRRAVKALVNEVAKNAGIKPYQVQSLLWFYEQRLFTEIGVPSPSYGFSDGGRKYAESRGRSGEASVSPAAEAVARPVKGEKRETTRPTKPVKGPSPRGKLSIQRGGDRGGRDQGGGIAPLAGAPIIEGATGPDPRIVKVAEEYAKKIGLPVTRQPYYATIDEDRARRIAQAYDEMKHDPQDPKVKEAYRDLIKQTKDQYKALTDAGYEFTFFDSETDPYGGNPWNAMRDLRQNQRMAVYGTYDGYGTEGITGAAIEDNPMLQDTGLRWPDQGGVMRPVTANDLFRAVHDAFGHGIEGAGFRAQGEENAWQAHVRLFTGPAVGAITSETRGQNSWLNYGPYGDKNRTAKLEDTVFAEQKTGLMPEWTWTEGRIEEPEVKPVKGIVLGTKQPGAISVKGSHYGNARVDELDATKYGTGLRGAERRRLEQAYDDRIKKRVNFYIKKDDGSTPTPEAGVGNYVYTQQFDNILGPGAEMSRLFREARGDSNDFESSVIDAGYDGYAVPSMGMMVVLNHNVPVNYVGPMAEVGSVKLSIARPKTEAFKKWFGDSDAVDENGNPLIVYTATNKDFTVFEPGRGASKDAISAWVTSDKDFVNNYASVKFRWWKTMHRPWEEDRMVPSGLNIIPAYVNPKNPFDVTSLIDDLSAPINDAEAEKVARKLKVSKAQLLNAIPEKDVYPNGFEREHTKISADLVRTRVAVDAMRNLGFDSVKAREAGSVVYALFDSDQIKSAISNVGTYSGPDIRYSLKAPTSPEFKRWFGNSKIVNKDGTPMVMYHGLAKDTTDFTRKTARGAPIFLTDDQTFAARFAADSYESVARNPEKYLSKEQIDGGVKRAIAAIKKDYGKDSLGKEMIESLKTGNLKEATPEAREYIQKEFINLLPTGPHIMPLYVRAERPFDYENPSHIRRVLAELTEDAYDPADIRSGSWESIENADFQDAIQNAGFDSFYVKEHGRKNLAVYEPNQVKSATGNLGTYSLESPDVRYSLRGVAFPTVKEAEDAAEAVKVPDTPAFKQFIAGSQWVDEDGKAKKFFHATTSNFFEFKDGVIYLSENAADAEKFGRADEDRLRSRVYRALNKDEKLPLFQRAVDKAVEEGKISAEKGVAFMRDAKRSIPDFDKYSVIKDEMDAELIDLAPKRMQIMPLYARAMTPFDFRNPDHVSQVMRYIESNFEYIRNPSERVKQEALERGFPTEYPDNWLKGLRGLLVQGYEKTIEQPPVQNAFRRLGFDGYITRKNRTSPLNYAVYQPQQVKSVTGNDGQFSLETKDIRYSLKNVRYSPDRFQKLWDESMYTQSDAENKTKGYLAFVDPMAFVKATARPETFEQLLQEREPLDIERLKAYDAVPFLSVSEKDGEWKITGHEGRHRMLALHDAGYREIPVYIHLRADDAKSIPVKTLKAQFTDAVSSILMAAEVEPLSYANKQKAMEKFTRMESKVKYSLPTLSQATNDRIKDVTPGRVELGWKDRVIGTFKQDYTGLRQKFLNRYETLGVNDRLLRDKIKKAGGPDLLADQSAEFAAFQSDLSAGVAASAMGIGDRQGGVPVYRNGLTTIDTSVKGLVESLAPLAKYGDQKIYQRYQFWAGWKRGRRLLREGREDVYTAADAKVAQEIEKAHPEFIQVQKDLIAFNNGIVKYAVQTGVLSRERAQVYTQYADYIPFYRQLDLDKTIGPNPFGGISGVKGPKELKGGDSPLGDFLENMVRNTQSMINAGMKNAAAQRATNVAMQINNSVTRLPAQTTGVGFDVYTQLENGQVVYYRSADPLFIEALKSLNMPDLPFMGLLSAPANVLRNLVTKDPGFMMANLLRDSLSSYVTSGQKVTPIVGTMVNFGKALTGKDKTLQALFNAGAIGGYEFSQNIEQSGKSLSADLNKKAGKDPMLLRPFKSLWEGLEKGTTASDAATRMAVYERVMKETGNEAEAISRALEVMNFNRKGNSVLIRIATAALPFFNARLQGLDLFYRASAGQMNTQDAQEIKRRFWIRGMTMASLSVMYYLSVADDEEYEKQEEETKDNNWIFTSLGIRIPIPFEVGTLFKTMPERITAYFMGNDTGKDLAQSTLRALANTFAFNPIPQTFKPIIEAATNYNFFTMRPIVGQGMQEVEPKFQVSPGTSKTAEFIGGLLNLSPLKVDQLIKGYTGTIGGYVTDVVDSIANEFSDVPKASKRFEQLPVVKRFALDPEARGSVTQFYELQRSVDTVVRTMSLLEKTARPEEYAEYLQKNIGVLAVKDYVRDIEKSMKELRDMRRFINSTKMDADEKRDIMTDIGRAEMNLTANIKEVKKVVSALK